MTSAAPTQAPDGAPVAPTSVPPRRGLGIASLVLALVPIVVALVLIVVAIPAIAAEPGGWALLGWTIFIVLVSGVAALVLGIVAIVLGAIAIRTRRGRGLGIAGIVLSALQLVPAIWIVGIQLASAAG